MPAVASPLVSIVTPSYNQALYLEDTLRSVLCQTYSPIEYLVVDGGSNDGSVDILKRYGSRLAGWVSEPDHGQADAINKGFRRATGEILAWINSDDLYYRPETVAHAVQALQDHPEVGMVYGDGVMVGGEGELLDWHRYPQYTLADLMGFNVLLQPAVFMRRQALEDAGYLIADFHMVLDHSLWVRIASRRPILHVDEFWAVERTHAGAKTIAQATVFVDEAFQFMDRLEKDAVAAPAIAPAIAEVFRSQGRQIRAGLNVFGGRRYIDAGRPREALGFFWHAFKLSPPQVMRYWFKVVQALGGILGLEKLFLAYRQNRRSVQHQAKRLYVDDIGVHWNTD